MENNKKRTAYVIYNQRLAGFLMMHGFVLLGLAPRPNGKNLFMFNDTDALHDAIDKWQIERLNKNNQ